MFIPVQCTIKHLYVVVWSPRTCPLHPLSLSAKPGKTIRQQRLREGRKNKTKLWQPDFTNGKVQQVDRKGSSHRRLSSQTMDPSSGLPSAITFKRPQVDRLLPPFHTRSFLAGDWTMDLLHAKLWSLPVKSMVWMARRSICYLTPYKMPLQAV